MIRPANIILIALCAVTAAVLFKVSARQGLWADEIFSLAMATGHSLEHPSAVARPELGDYVEAPTPLPAAQYQRYLQHESAWTSPARVVRAVQLSDTSPPLYYLLLSGWTLVFGTSDLAVRFFSIACAVACLPLMYAVARRTGAGRAALSASCLLAASPLFVYYGTEARMYSLLWLLVLAMALISLMLRQRGRGLGLHVGWVLASTAGFLTHYFFLFPWLAVVAFLLLRPGRERRWWVMTRIGATAMLLLPWYWQLPQSLRSWRITEGWLAWAPENFTWLGAARDLVGQFFSGQSPYLWIEHPRAKLLAVLAFAIAFIVLVARTKTRVFHGGRLLLWLWLLAACAGPLIHDWVRGTYTSVYSRYATAAMPAAFLLAAAGLSFVGLRARLALLLLVFGGWALSFGSIYKSRARNGQPMKEIARAVAGKADAEELILIHSIPSGVLGVARYAHPEATIASWVGQLGVRRMPESLIELAANQRRVLLVKVHTVGEPAPEEDWLREHARLHRETTMGSAVVVDFRPKTPGSFLTVASDDSHVGSHQ